MKRIFSFFSVAIALATVSCQRVEIDNSKNNVSNSEEIQSEQSAINNVDKIYTFSIVEGRDEVTKTIIGTDGVDKYAKWEDGDELGYLVNTDASKTSDVSVVGDNVTFSVTGALAVSDYLFAWFPNYEPLVAGDTEVEFNIPIVQVQDATTGYDMDAFPMVSNPIEVTSEMLEGYDSEANNEKPLADVRFANLASLINFRVFSSNATYQSEKVISITFDAGTDIIAGTYAIDVYAIDFNDDATLALRGSQNDAPLEKGSSIITTTLSEEEVLTSHTDKASAMDVFMTVIPGDYSGKVVVLTDKASYTFKINSPLTFARGAINTLNLDLNRVGTSAVRQLPISWNLSTASYDTPTSSAQVKWSNDVVDMVADKYNAGTNANNYLGGDTNNRTSSRFYKDSKLSFVPKIGAHILKVDYTATSSDYASAVASSVWTNATASVSGSIATIVPENITNAFYGIMSGTTGSTKVEVFYYGAIDPALTGSSISRSNAVAGNETSTLSPRNMSNISYSVIDAPTFVDEANISFSGDVMTVPFLDNKTLVSRSGKITVRATGDEGTADAEIDVEQSASVFEVASTDDINIAWNDKTAKTVTFTSTFALTDSNISNDNTTDFSASFAAGVNPNEYILSIAANADNESGSFNVATISVSRDGLTAIDIDVIQAYNGGATPLSAPSNVQITAMTANSFNASWNSVANADGYHWVLSTADDPNDVEASNTKASGDIASGSTTTLSQTELTGDNELAGKTAYYFHIYAKGSGSWANSDNTTVGKGYMIIDGSTLTGTATTEETDKTYYTNFTVTLSSGAKAQSSGGSNRFSTDAAILIGKSGAYINNSKCAVPGAITKFEIFYNNGASTKASFGIKFSASTLAAYGTGTNTYIVSSPSVDTIYDASANLPSNAKYFWYQVTNANNTQVQFRILYTPDTL